VLSCFVDAKVALQTLDFKSIIFCECRKRVFVMSQKLAFQTKNLLYCATILGDKKSKSPLTALCSLLFFVA